MWDKVLFIIISAIPAVPPLVAFVRIMVKPFKYRMELRRYEDSFLRATAYIAGHESNFSERERQAIITKVKYRYYRRIYGFQPLTIHGYEKIDQYISRYHLHPSVIKNVFLQIRDGKVLVNKWRIIIVAAFVLIASIVMAVLAISITPDNVQSWLTLKIYIRLGFVVFLSGAAMWYFLQFISYIIAYSVAPKVLVKVNLNKKCISPYKIYHS